MNNKTVRETLDRFITAFLPNLDCDGCTRLVGQLLSKINIDYKIFTGAIRNRVTDDIFPLHYWIEVEDIIFDFKAEKWIGVKGDDVEYLDIEEIDRDEFMMVGQMSRINMFAVLLEYG